MVAVEEREQQQRLESVHWHGYVVPIALFLAITYLEGLFPSCYVALYVTKVLIVTTALFALRQPLGDLRFDRQVIPRAALVGLGVCVLWVGWDRAIPYPHIGSRSAFNPFAGIEDPALRGLFIGLTLYSMAVMVPVMEELFWRSFLIRYFTTAKWRHILPWQYSAKALLGVSLLFGLAHTEWLVAILCAFAYGWLLKRTHSLFACVVAHGVTNLALALYILQTGSWKYW